MGDTSYITGGNSSVTGAAQKVQAISYSANISSDPRGNYRQSNVPSGENWRPSAVQDAGRRPKVRSDNPANRYAIGRLTAKAFEILRNMQTSIVSENVMESANFGYELEKLLEKMWELRKTRESNFGDVVNLLQIALAKEKYEEWTVEHCAAVERYVRTVIGVAPVGREQCGLAISLLHLGKLDPWKGISDDVAE